MHLFPALSVLIFVALCYSGPIACKDGDKKKLGTVSYQKQNARRGKEREEGCFMKNGVGEGYSQKETQSEHENQREGSFSW